MLARRRSVGRVRVLMNEKYTIGRHRPPLEFQFRSHNILLLCPDLLASRYPRRYYVNFLISCYIFRAIVLLLTPRLWRTIVVRDAARTRRVTPHSDRPVVYPRCRYYYIILLLLYNYYRNIFLSSSDYDIIKKYYHSVFFQVQVLRSFWLFRHQIIVHIFLSI